MKIILASGSPRRKEQMQKTGLEFEIDPADFDERSVSEKSTKKLVEILAFKKAESVAKRHTNSLIIGSDLLVSYKNKQIGKPKDAKDAKKILKLLRGKTHQVYNAIAVINTESGKTASIVEVAEVTMRNYSDGETDNYISTGEPLDKGGAYAIQGLGGKLVKEFKGDREVIIGLPIKTVLKLIKICQKQ
jgi:septum formation protein